jgi:hypothetical protein
MHFITLLQSLKIFKQALKEDDLPLRFDLRSMHRRCAQLLHRIQETCLEQLPHDSAIKELEGDYSFNTFSGYLIAGIAGVARGQPTLDPQRMC